MGRVRYSINLTLDGCVHHEGIATNEELHLFWADAVGKADVLLYGRVTYQMMEGAWRPLAEAGKTEPGTPDWILPFAQSMHRAKKYVVSDTLDTVDWNAQLIRGKDLAEAVQTLKAEQSGTISVGGVVLPQALATLDLIDEYEFVIHPVIAGHGPTLLAGLPSAKTLKLLNQRNFATGAVAMLYERAA